MLPLNMIEPGQIVELADLLGGHAMHKRLADLGLNIGTRVRVIQGDLAGPLIIAFRNDSRLALGRGVAQQIMVRLCGEE